MENKKNEIMMDGFIIRTFELPPEGFDPLTAEQSKLAHYGIVARPDKEKEPELYKRWHRVYSKKLNHIIPKFKEIKRKDQDGKDKPKSFGPYSPRTWSGVVATPPTNVPFKTVEGYIPIPAISIPIVGGTELNFAAWIGLDGKIAPDNNLLQVGIALAPDEINVESYFPIFCQWGSNSHLITNLATDFGDTINCLICADALSDGQPSSSKAAIFITDINNNNHTSFEITAPAGIVWKGKTAEWIVENAYGNESPFIPLSNVGEYTFTQCIAGYQGTHGLINVNSGSGSVVNMPQTFTENRGPNSVFVMNNPLGR